MCVACATLLCESVPTLLWNKKSKLKKTLKSNNIELVWSLITKLASKRSKHPP